MKTLLYPAFALLTVASCKNGTPEQAEQASTAPAPIAGKNELPVILLPTVDATEDDPYNYPKTFPSPANADLAAYGAARNVWLGPREWTGEGSAATNGGKRLQLYPKGGDKPGGPHIVYYSESSCIGCMLGHAAAYFPQALIEYNETYNDDGTNPPPIHPRLRVEQIGPNMVAFMLPDSNGLSTHGIAYYRNDSVETYFAEATFTLPSQQATLSETLAKAFISRFTSDQ
jgi:hypothetical protein